MYLGGTLPREDQFRFKKLLFRTTRGKAFVNFFEMDIPQTDKLRGMSKYENKLVYICTFEEGSYLRDRITKLCSSFLEPL